MTEKLYLMEFGGEYRDGGLQAVYLQPMIGTPEKLREAGASLKVSSEVYDLMRSGNMVLPGDRLPSVTVEAPATCPRRMTDHGPWEKKEGLDRWDKVGPDRVCSFCGSMHPDDMRAALSDPEAKISISDKRYKVYIRRPGILNAGMGAIKWYVWHGDQALIDAINQRAGAA